MDKQKEQTERNIATLKAACYDRIIVIEKTKAELNQLRREIDRLESLTHEAE